MGTRRTNRQSSLLEQSVEALHLLDFQVYNSIATFERAQKRVNRYVVRNWQHSTIYGTPGKKEAYIVSPPAGDFAVDKDGCARIIIEAKYQDGSGSVDEKLPFVWESFLDSPVPNWILVYGGRYWRKGRGKAAIDWIRERARLATPNGRTFHVKSRTGFIHMAKSAWGDRS